MCAWRDVEPSRVHLPAAHPAPGPDLEDPFARDHNVGLNSRIIGTRKNEAEAEAGVLVLGRATPSSVVALSGERLTDPRPPAGKAGPDSRS